jgi:hypothetical protein
MTSALSCLARRDVLQSIERSVLTRFLDSFKADLAAKNIGLPHPELSDDDFFAAVTAIFALPENLPARVREALTAVDGLATPAGRHKLLSDLSGLAINFDPRWSDAQCAIQTWLLAPGLLNGFGALTLEPLRADGPKSLDPAGLDGVLGIRLCQLEIVSDNGLDDTTIKKSADLFHNAVADGPAHDPIPAVGRLTHATFEFQLANSPEPCVADIHPPHTLKVARPSDTQIIQTCLTKKGFIVPVYGSPGKTEHHGQSLEGS